MQLQQNTRLPTTTSSTHLFHDMQLRTGRLRNGNPAHDASVADPTKQAPPHQTQPQTAAKLISPPIGIPWICHAMDTNITNETDVKLKNALAMTGVGKENHPRQNDCDFPGFHN